MFLFVNANDIPPGSIKGIVRSQDGKPAAFVSVQLKNSKYGTYTDENGVFVIKRVAKGDYTLVVSHTGLKTKEEQVSVDPDKITEIHVELKEDSRQLEQVIVNANRSSNVQPAEIGKMPVAPRDYPQAIQIINGKVIADQQGNRLSDVLKNVNGVALGTTRGAVQETFYARGYSLGSNNIFKNGSRTNAASLPEAATLESVEVLKGSAALLYGGVSGGAVVNMVTKQPKFNYGGEISLRAGSYDFFKPMADFYGPITKNLAFRAIGTYEKSNSFRDVVHSERIYINPSLLYKVSDKTSVTFVMDYLKTDFTPDFGIGSIGGKIRSDIIPRNTFFNTPWAYNKIDQVTTNLNLDHKFNEKWRMNVVASYQTYKRNYFGTERIQFDDNGGWKRVLTRNNTDEDYYTTQVNFIGNVKIAGISNKILMGVDGDITRTRTTGFGFNNAYDSINAFNPESVKNARTDIPATPDSLYTTAPVRRFGAYVQDLISITGKLKLLAGIRWSFQETPATSIHNIIKDSAYNGTTAYKNDKAFSPRVGLVYQPLKSTSIFVSYSNNFSPNSGVDINQEALKPSIIDQFEAGVKNDFFDGKLSANLTVYRVINNNLALPDERDVNAKILAGQTTSDGFEIDLSGALSKNIYFLAGYSNNYMRFTKTSGQDGSFIEGEKLVNNTAQTANGTMFYTFDKTALKGLKIGFSTFYTGKRVAGWNNTQKNRKEGVNRNIPVGDFTTFDVSLGYSFKKVSVLAKLSNLTDVYNYYVHENYSVNPIPPRQFSATVSYKF
jgi:iron complex outermembrane receptor protein